MYLKNVGYLVLVSAAFRCDIESCWAILPCLMGRERSLVEEQVHEYCVN